MASRHRRPAARPSIDVGEVTVVGTIKGMPSDSGGGIESAVVANKFWDLCQAHTEVRALPEPTSVVVFDAGLVGAAAVRLRNKK
jgi:hypothetical protein